METLKTKVGRSVLLTESFAERLTKESYCIEYGFVNFNYLALLLVDISEVLFSCEFRSSVSSHP